MIIIEILDSVKRYYDSTYEELEYPNVRRYIANAVAHNVLPPGYVAPAPILIEGAINAILNPENLILEVPPLPQVDAPVAWDLESAWKEYCLEGILFKIKCAFHELLQEYGDGTCLYGRMESG